MQKSKYLLLCLMLLVSLRASSQEATPVHDTSQATQAPTRDLTQIKSSAQYVQINTRAKWLLDTIYPYNIDLYNLDSVGAVSSAVLPPLGKPVILAFWLTTCYPCRMELDAYTRNYEQWKKEADFELIAISIDFPGRFHQVGEIARQQKYPFPVLWDMNREFPQVMPGGLNGLPQVFVIDRNGQIAYHKRKYGTGDELKLWEVVKGL
jgi:cytochrome c biogenesis protein CcmG, thiol:disulfide interchange protein DsbE